MEESLKQQEKEHNENEEIKEMGQLTLDQGKARHKIHLLRSEERRVGKECL